jgi:hypothetical protein
VTQVAGRPHKPNALGVFPGQDATGVYVKRCIAFADDNGWVRAEVCGYWGQLALIVEKEGGRPRGCAEDLAWRHVEAALGALRQEATN